MKIARTIAEMRDLTANSSRPLGFVATMGALHDGHLSLVRAAREQCHEVVMSIFVNPLQFGPSEDFDRYPRDEERDLKLAEREGVDIAFVPSVDEMYPGGRATSVSVSGVTDRYEGASRPGHFDGVATVVAKLFGIVGPDLAFFGQKDAQQVAVVRRMVTDLSIPVEVVGCPTIREPDGLAVSSRNAYLDDAERKAAPVIHRCLGAGRASLEDLGEPAAAESAMLEALRGEPLVRVEYAAAVDPASFGPPVPGGQVLLIVAATLGRTRLIDNLPIDVGGQI